MSLITQQTLLQTQSDLNDLLRRIAVGEDTPKIRGLVNGMKKQILQLEKKFEAEKAANVQKQKAEAPKVAKGPAAAGQGERPKKKALPPLPADMDLTCADCTNCFVFSGKDQVFFKKNDWKAPMRCTECREARKNKKPAGKTIACGDCGVEFFFSEAKQKQFAEKKWDDPKWCRPCKIARKAKWEAEQAAKVVADAEADVAALSEAEPEPEADAEAKKVNEDLGPR